MIMLLKSVKNLVFLFICAFVLWQFWAFLAPRAEPLQQEEHAAVYNAIQRMIPLLEAVSDSQPLRFGVIRFRGDSSGEVTAAVKAALAGQNGWTVDDSSVVQRIVGDIAQAITESSSLEELMQAGQQVSLDVVLLGKVQDVKLLPEGATATIDFHFRDLRSGDWMLRQSITGVWKPNLFDTLRAPVPGWLRLVAWLLIVALLPWVTPFFTHWAIEQKSNRASTFLVLAYTTLALLLAALFLGFTLEGAGSWLLLVGAVVLAGGYSWWACERVAEGSG